MSVGLRCKDKVTIVTGGSRGIGKGIATVFVRHGSRVVFCSNEETEGQETEKELNNSGEPGEAKFIFTDLRNEDHIKRLINETIKLYGRIDYVINNAGWHPPYKTIDEFTSEDFRSLMDLNVLAYYLVAKYSLPHLRKTQGNIINISSTSACAGINGSSIYDATKGAIHAFTRSLATEEGKNNVRVNSVSPGSIITPLAEETFAETSDPEKAKQACGDLSVLGRNGTVEEIGLACLYLAVEATFCTGIDIEPSGGILLNFGFKNEKNTNSWPRALFP